MRCKYYDSCTYCANYYPESNECEVYGLPIGSGDPFCANFRCNVDECKKDHCISDDELFSIYNVNL